MFGTNSVHFNNTFDYQNRYLTYKFTSKNHAWLGTESLIGNCQNFVIVGIPITIIGFLLGHLVFRMLFSFRISKFIRKFDFWLFIFLLLFDGNVQ